MNNFLTQINELDAGMKKNLKKLAVKLTFGGIVEVCFNSIVNTVSDRFLPQQAGIKGKAIEVGKKVASGMAAGAVNNYIFDDIDKAFEEGNSDN